MKHLIKSIAKKSKNVLSQSQMKNLKGGTENDHWDG